MSLACESVAAVNRVVLQHMSISILDCVSDNLVGLSAPSDSMMMQRRKSLQKGQSLQLNRLNTKVLSIQVLLGDNIDCKPWFLFWSTYSKGTRFSIQLFPVGPGRTGTNCVSILLKCSPFQLSTYQIYIQKSRVFTSVWLISK